MEVDFSYKKAMDSYKLAKFLAENFDKESIITEIFNYFDFDCLGRCNINPAEFDELVRRFENSDEYDVRQLVRIIETVRISKRGSKNKENQLIKKIADFISENPAADNLSDGRKYLVANVDEFDRSRLAFYVTETGGTKFKKKIILFDKQTTKIAGATACHYPAAYESNGKMYIIATLNYEWSTCGAVLFVVKLDDF